MRFFIFVILFFPPLFTFGQNAGFEPDSVKDLYLSFSKSKSVLFEKDLSDSDRKFYDTFFKQYYKDFDNKALYDTLKTLPIDAWELFLYKNRKSQQSALKEAQANISSKLFDRLKTEIEYQYWHLIAAYPVLRSNANTKNRKVTSIPSVFFKGLIERELKSDSLFDVKSYRTFMPYYITFKNSEKQKLEKYSDMSESVKDKIEFAEKLIGSGRMLDFEIASLIKDNEIHLSLPFCRYFVSQIETPEIQAMFDQVFFNRLYEKDKLTLKEKKDKILTKRREGYIQFNDLNAKPFDFSKYEGKVVYVDFWASWCGPCRKEFPHSLKMYESLSKKEREKIVFLCISIDENEDAWKAAVEKLGIKILQNGHSNGGWSSEAAQKYQINSIPRYMIVNQKGEVVETAAPRPSNPETLDKLKELVK